MNGTERRRTREVGIGTVRIGGAHPIAVQSMTTTDTRDVEATVAQIRALEDAGCEIVRVAVPDARAVEALPAVRARIRTPLIADIHFDANLALAAIDAGVDKIRVNPGNLGGVERFREVLRAARGRGVPIRIGVNSGSVPRDLLERFGAPTPEAMLEAAIRFVDVAEGEGHAGIVLSIKSSDTLATVRANRLLSARIDHPLHLGITEAGEPRYGAIKSAAGLGALLLDGIGDTIRVSLTGDPVREIPVAFDILKATARRITSPEIIACPTCGRLAIDVEALVAEVERRLAGVRLPLRISILGCVVNGPGEAREADLGIAAGRKKAMLFRRGEIVRTGPVREMVDALIEEVKAMDERGTGAR
ncbi:MAG: flavodoxin-dependent (E)-4-hydroxy-3-methylbut-2-enyl-diphosphate synthase [Planctomycetes bacterium]|nr:flavodoxin-dependent (E)-4-hydroxy-3-methylbut-2-enyl-diphosphate synthase [Planctomycetota bacterium]